MALTSTGLERPRLNEIKSDIDDDLTQVIGPINTGPDAVLGQMTGIQAASLDDAYETLEDVYNSMYPATAEGVSLDRAVALLGIIRLNASPVVVTAVVYGSEGTVIPENALAHADVQYFNTSPVTISSNAAIDARVQVSNVADGTLYRITINGVQYSYTSGVGSTKSSILNGLDSLIPSGYLSTVSNDQLRIYAVDGQTPFNIDLSAGLSFANVGSPAIFVSVVSGLRELPVGALASIDTPVFGWTGINNLIPGAGSRDVETDIELRQRQADSSRVTGSATVKAIRSRLLQEVAGVTAVSVFENRSHIFVAGQPPHSFEALVQGGTDQAVAQNIWENKPAGIETYGNVDIEVEDDNGDDQTIRFSRPVGTYAWVRVTINSLYPEEPLPASTAQAIKDAVIAAGLSMTVGEDLITQRFIGPIYANTQGIGMLTVETAITSTPNGTPTYSTSNKPVDRSSVALFSTDRIEVVGL